MGENFLIQSFEWLKTIWNDYISPMVIIRSYEGGVVLSMGKYQRSLKQGVNWKFPYPFNESHKCLIKPETISVEVTVTTVDGKTMQVEVIGEYEVIDPAKWILEANDAATNIKDLLKGWTADIAVDSTAEDLNKKPIKTKIRNKLNEETQALGARFNRILFGKIVSTRSISMSGISVSGGSTSLML